MKVEYLIELMGNEKAWVRVGERAGEGFSGLFLMPMKIASYLLETGCVKIVKRSHCGSRGVYDLPGVFDWEIFMTRWAGYLVVLAGFCWVGAAGAQPHPETRKPLVKTKLVADTSAIVAGVPFDVGVVFTVERDWHIYWKNPGESGLPTKITFELPDGFSAGEVQFPLPEQFPTGIGYEGEVMLIAKITPPATLDAAQKYKFTAKATWLVCSDICIPGKASPAVTVAVADKVKPAHLDLFAKWRAQLPAEIGQGEQPIDVTFEGSLPEDHSWTTLKIVATSGRAIKDPLFFAGSTDAVLIRKIEVNSNGDRMEIFLEAKILSGQKLGIEKLPGLLTYAKAGGLRGGVTVNVPVAAESTKPTEGG